MTIKFKRKSVHQSEDGLSIKKIIGSISPKEFIKLLKEADNKVNPRIAKENKITKSIHETLDGNPQIFFFKNKGILIATQNFNDSLDRNRAEISLNNIDSEGIMDGGHTTLALATYILKKTLNIHTKSWEESKKVWIERYDDIMASYDEDKFPFTIPVEIITPDDTDQGLNDYLDYLSDICEGRNNNVQLKETSKANHQGIYDNLKENLKNYSISWKANDGGKTKSEDVISLACLPLIFLKQNGYLPDSINELNKISLYSSKGKCVEYFNSVLSHEEISISNTGQELNGKRLITHTPVESSMNLIEDILKFFDKLYLNFPDLYHKSAPGKFGRISCVEKKSIPTFPTPFKTTPELSEYDYPFGFFYPILTSITQLMKIDPITKKISWIQNPNSIDLDLLDLSNITNLIKTVNWDPQKIGKNSLGYSLGERMFEDYVNNIKQPLTI